MCYWHQPEWNPIFKAIIAKSYGGVTGWEKKVIESGVRRRCPQTNVWNVSNFKARCRVN
jgi:hypothetical protein